MDEREPELIDYLGILWRRKWLVALGTLAAVLVGGFATWLQPRTYRLQVTIDAGDLGDDAAKNIERLVARVNAGSLLGSGDNAGAAQPVRVTAEFRKPFVVELQVDTQAPMAAKVAVERTATHLVEELSRVHRLQKARHDAKIDAVQMQLDLARQEAVGLVAQIRADVVRSGAATRAALDLARATIQRLTQQEGLAERRLAELRPLLDELRAARARALTDATGPAGVLLLSQLSSEIVDKQQTVAFLEGELAAELPRELQRARAEERSLSDQLGAWERARKALEAEPAGEWEAALETVRTAFYRASAPGTADATSLETALTEVTAKLPGQMRALERQVGELRRDAAGERPARVTAGPEVPGSPIRPRRTLNLAVSLVAGLMGSVLLAFAVDYVTRAKGRARVG